jgi:hypothetical protein
MSLFLETHGDSSQFKDNLLNNKNFAQIVC